MNGTNKQSALHTRYNPCKSNGYLIRSKTMEHLKIRNVSCTLDLPLFYYFVHEDAKLKILSVMPQMKCPGCNESLWNYKNAKTHMELNFCGSGMLINLGVDVVLVVFNYKLHNNNWECNNKAVGNRQKLLTFHDIPFSRYVNPVYEFNPYLHLHNSWKQAFDNYSDSPSHSNFTCDPNALVLHIYSVSMDTILNQLHIPTLKPMTSFIFALVTCHLGAMLTELNITKNFKFLLVDLYSKKMITQDNMLLYLDVLDHVKGAIRDEHEFQSIVHTELMNPIPSPFHVDDQLVTYPIAVQEGIKRPATEYVNPTKKKKPEYLPKLNELVLGLTDGLIQQYDPIVNDE